jgi:hypothetical protein
MVLGCKIMGGLRTGWQGSREEKQKKRLIGIQTSPESG